MNQKEMNRRNFLKTLGQFSLGMLLLPVSKFFKQNQKEPLRTLPSREAKFYNSSNHLAG